MNFLANKALRNSQLVNVIQLMMAHTGEDCQLSDLERSRSTPVGFKFCFVKLKELGHHAWLCLGQLCIRCHLHAVEYELGLLTLYSR